MRVGGVTIITTDEWDTLTTLCFTSVQTLSDEETKIIEAFGAVGSIILSLFVVSPFFWTFCQALKSKKRVELEVSIPQERNLIKGLGSRAVIVLIPLLIIPEIWGIFRIRNIQQALSDAIDNEYTDNQWTFGQVVAVVIFAPVLIEVAYLCATT